MQESAKKGSVATSVRLDPEAKKRLEERAAKAGMGTSELARKLLADSLSDESELVKMDMRLASAEKQIRGLREDLSVAVQALLVVQSSGQKVTPDQAQEWVKANLNNDD